MRQIRIHCGTEEPVGAADPAGGQEKYRGRDTDDEGL